MRNLVGKLCEIWDLETNPAKVFKAKDFSSLIKNFSYRDCGITEIYNGDIVLVIYLGENKTAWCLRGAEIVLISNFYLSEI